MKTKKCTKCGIEKPLDAEHYHRDSLSPSGFRSWCKVCNAEYSAEYHQNNKEAIAKQKAERYSRPEVKERIAERYQNNKERIAERYQNNKEEKKKYQAERYQNNKEEKKKYQAERYQNNKDKQPACVYKIVNSVNNKVYIGQTTRGELRWKEHLKDLRNGRTGKWNHKLLEDFNKFGEEAFEWSIIKEYPKDKDTLLLEEARTIVKYRKEGKQLYNIHITENK